ncbi:uncharacterized protein LOC143468953 [Clavelina lepadiformis]|uniref:uncharacterized protein LOC143468953 n=1 Tax=Clavelina lepadiformis TaxID=159417 RepID=UPI0040427A9D
MMETTDQHQMTFGKYKKLTTKREEERFLKNHPSELPLDKLSLSTEALDSSRRTTWYAGQNSSTSQIAEIDSFKRRSGQPASVKVESSSRPKTLESKLAKSDPQLSTRVKESPELRKQTRLSSDESPTKFGFVRLREKSSPFQKRSEKSVSVYGDSLVSSKKNRHRTGIFSSSVMRRPRNTLSSSPLSLTETLENKKFRTAFNDFLGSEYSSENLRFWTSCEKFRKMKSAEQRLREGRWIYSQYISPNAPHQINIDYITRRQVTLMFTSDEKIPSDIFDNAQRYVFAIMENDSFPRFINSNYYKEAICKKNAFESMFGGILAGSKSTGVGSPHKTGSSLKSNSNGNNNTGPSATESTGDNHSSKNVVVRRFSFGFKKTHSTKSESSGSIPDIDPNIFIPVQVSVA